jgi:hypothetical protein
MIMNVPQAQAHAWHTYLGVIGAVKSLGEVGRLCEGHTAETANETASDDALLATEDSDLETRVLRSLEHLMSMKTIERLCRILARDCTVDEDGPPARMQVCKAGYIVDLSVYDDPLR